MELDSKRLEAVFFISGKGGENSLPDLLQDAGATQILMLEDCTGIADFVWAEWSCKGYISDLSNHKVLHVYFWKSDFLENLDDVVKPVDQDGLHNLIKAFEFACDRLAPEIAVIITHTWQMNLDLLQKYESMTSTKDIDGLLREHFGLLYLGGEFIANSAVNFQDRDILETNSGLMIFAGNTSSRWF